MSEPPRFMPYMTEPDCDQCDALQARVRELEERPADKLILEENIRLQTQVKELQKEVHALSENLWISNKAAVDIEKERALLLAIRDMAAVLIDRDWYGGPEMALDDLQEALAAYDSRGEGDG